MRNLSVGVLAAVLVFSSCASAPSDSPRVSRLETDYFDARYQYSPTFASAMGVHQFDGRLDDVSELAIGRRTDEVARMLVRERAMFEQQEYTREDHITGSLIEYALRAELADWRSQLLWQRSPLFYANLPFYAIDRTMRRQYASPSDRLRALIITIHEVEAVMAAMRGNVTSVSRPLAQASLDRLRQLQSMLRGYLPSWGARSAGVDMRLGQNLQAALPGAIQSVEQSINWLQQEMLPNATSDYAMGPEQFISELLFDSHLELTISELESLATKNLDRDSEAFVKAAAKVAPGEPPKAALARLAAQPIESGKLLTAARQEADQLRTFLRQHNLVTLPADMALQESANYNILEAPPYLLTPLSPYFYDMPALEGTDARTGYLLIGAPPTNWPEEVTEEYRSRLTPQHLRLEVAATLLPGRFLQDLNRLRYPTRTGKLLSSRITRDGWAHYVETMVLEQGYGDGDPLLELTAAHRSLIRDCRFLASVRLHTRGMTLEEASKLFMDRAYVGEQMATLEAQRVMYDPLCLGESLGKTLILGLRDEYLHAGAGHDLAAFHAAFLKNAALPLPMIREALLESGSEKSD